MRGSKLAGGILAIILLFPTIIILAIADGGDHTAALIGCIPVGMGWLICGFLMLAPGE